MTGPFRFSPEQSSTGFDFSLGSDANPMLETARGRAQEQSQNSADNLDKLITLRERTKDPLQADRLDRLIKQYTSLKTGSIGDFAAGAAGGVADAPLSVVSTLLGLGPSSISNVAARGRRGVQEAQAGLRELTGNTDPTNIAGTVGEMAGGMIGGAPVFGKAAQAVGAGVSKVIPALEPLMTGATDLSKISNPAVRAIVQRMTSGTANVIAGAPINAAQTLSSEAPWDEKVKSAAIQSGADFLFGLGHTPSAKPKVTNTVDPNTPAATPESGALADELSAKFKEAEANRAAAKQLREEAKAQWIVDNMAGGKKWGDLSKNDKAQVYVDYSEKRKAPEVAPTELPADTQPSPIKPTDILDPTAADIPALRDRAAVAIDDATAAAKTPRTEDPNGPPQASTPVEQEIASAEYHINRLKQVGDLAGANDLIPHLNKVKKLVGMEPMALEVLPVLDKLGKMNSDQLDNHLDEIYKVLDSAHEKSPEYVQASNDLNDVINEKLRRQQMGKDPLLDEVKGLPAEPATIAPPVDPIQDKLEALKRGETITPKMPEELNSNLEKEFLRINVRDLTPRELLDTYNKWQSWIGGQKELWDMTDHNLDAETQSLQKIKNLPGGYLEDPYAVHRMIAEDLKSAVRQSRVINAAARLEKTGQLDQILSLRHDDRMSMQGIAEKLSINPDTVMDVLEFLGKTEIQYGQPRPKDVAAMNAATKVELDKLNAIKETADRTLKMLHQMSVPQMEQGKIPTPDTTVPTPGEALADGLRKGPKAVRAKDFAETGNYDVEINGKVYQIFRDADAKAWYQDPSNTGEHFSKNWLGTTKTEALAALHERVTGEKKSAMLENIGRTVESRKAAKEVSLTGETPKGEQLDVKRLAQPVSKLPDGQIQLQIDHVHEKLAEAKTLNDSDMIGDYERRLSKLMDEQAKRKGPPDAPSSGKGLTANIPPGIGGALLGATYGLRTAKDDEDAAKRAFLYAMIGGFGSSAVFRGGNYIARMRELRKESGELFAGELALRKNSKLAIETSKTLSELIDDAKSRPRQAYEQVANRSIGAQRVAAAFPQLHNAPMESNFAKQIFTAGRWVSKTENALGGDGITITGKNGNPIHVTGPYNKILAMVNGDVDGLDRVRIALASAEGAIAGRQVPMDLQTREAYIRNAPKEYIEASKAARDYNLGLMKVMLEAGRISTEGYAAMANEQWYAPLLQAAKDVSSAKYAKLRFVGQEKVVFGRKQGGSTEILSPTQVDMEVTARVMRAAEFGKAVNSLIDFAEKQPKVIRDAIIRPVDKVSNPEHDQIRVAADKLATELGLSGSDARNLLAYLDTNNLGAPDGKIAVYRNGELQSYRVDADLFNAVQTMTPMQWEYVTHNLSKVTQFASRGVVYDPFFIASQFVIDNLATFIQSKYGMNPLVDTTHAIVAQLFRTKSYRELLAEGGPASWQSLQYANPKLVASSVETAGSNAFEIAAKNVKEMNLMQAYKTLVNPIAEAARVAEYLAARRHGASAMEATYAAWDVMGNTRMEGASQLVHSLNQMAMFSRPSISALDKLLKESGMHPFQVPEYSHTVVGKTMERVGVPARAAAMTQILTKGLIAITLPTIALWTLSKDDEEIRQMRQTKTGVRYWFFRNPVDQSIVRMRKPHVYGELLGTSVERALDVAYGKDPQSVGQIASALGQDASFNVIPLPVQIAWNLGTNQDSYSDRPIVSEGDKLIEPSLAGANKATPFARGIAQAIAPATAMSTNEMVRTAGSPAGIDYAMGAFGGMLGQDALKLLGVANQWRKDGIIPPKEELPIISKVFIKYPSTGAGSIGAFYETAQNIDEATKTLKYYEDRDPSKIAPYIEANKALLIMADMFNSTRKELVDNRRAIEDLKNMTGIDPANRNQIIDQLTLDMIRKAKMANELYKRMQQ